MKTPLLMLATVPAEADWYVRFGPAHTATLLLVLAACWLSVALVRLGGRTLRRRQRLVLAIVMVAGALTEIGVGIGQGWGTLEDLAPLQLCDLSLMLGALTLVTLQRRTVEPLYFFALSGTVPALLTPELPADVSAFRFGIYFLLHGLTVVAAVTLVLGLRLVPAHGAWWRALLAINAYAVVVGIVNLLLGTNFGYLCAKPSDPTLFDWLGPWPWYIVSLEAVCLVVFVLLDLPLARLRGLQSSSAGSSSESSSASGILCRG